MNRQKEINVKLIIQYSLLIQHINNFIHQVESDGVTSFKDINTIYSKADLKDLFSEEETEYIGYIEEITDKEKKKAITLIEEIGIIEKLADVSEELMTTCGF